MDAWEILAIVLAIGVIALVGFTIPVLIQLKDILKSAEMALNTIEKEVEPVIQHVGGITGNFEGITGVANSYVHKKHVKSEMKKDEPGTVDKIKETAQDKWEVVKNHYIPMIVSLFKKYWYALSFGFKTGVKDFKEYHPVHRQVRNEPEVPISEPVVTNVPLTERVR